MGQGLGKGGSTVVEFFFFKTKQPQNKCRNFFLVTGEVQCKDRLLAANNEASSIQGVSLLLTLEVKVCKLS